MSIPDMQRYSLVYSENTPAYALADRLGGWSKRAKLFSRYGQSRSPEVKTFSEDNKTTTVITSMSWNIFGIIKKNMRIY